MFITGVNGDKLFSSVKDTSDKFIAGVVDTGDYSLSQIFSDHRCRCHRRYKDAMEENSLSPVEKFISGVVDTGEV